MTERIKLKAARRPEVGRKIARQLRRQGFILGVLYGGKEGNIPLSIERRRQVKGLEDLYLNQILNLEIREGEKDRPHLVIIKELQRHQLSGDMLHVDFQEISLDEKLTAPVPVTEVGEPIGVTRDGGILEHVLREIEIKCLPDQLPEAIEVDVASLEIGDSIHVSDIKLEEGLEVLTEPEGIVFTVSAPRVEEEIVAPEEEEVPEVAGEEEEEAGKEEGAGPEKTEEAGGKEK